MQKIAGPPSFVNLKVIPTMILVSEASYHAVCSTTAPPKWLNQARREDRFSIRLEDRGNQGQTVTWS